MAGVAAANGRRRRQGVAGAPPGKWAVQAGRADGPPPRTSPRRCRPAAPPPTGGPRGAGLPTACAGGHDLGARPHTAGGSAPRPRGGPACTSATSGGLCVWCSSRGCSARSCMCMRVKARVHQRRAALHGHRGSAPRRSRVCAPRLALWARPPLLAARRSGVAAAGGGGSRPAHPAAAPPSSPAAAGGAALQTHAVACRPVSPGLGTAAGGSAARLFSGCRRCARRRRRRRAPQS